MKCKICWHFLKHKNEFKIVLVFANGLPIGHWFSCLQIMLDNIDYILLLPKQDHVYLNNVSCHLCLAKE
jgi:hypothetical protein